MPKISKAKLFDIEIAFRSAAAAAGARRRAEATRTSERPVDLFLCLVDHFEPQIGQPPSSVARERLEDWLRHYPKIAGRHRDADGRPPAHSFFYPYDEYDDWEMARLSQMCAQGWGEIDVHLHHKDDTEESLRAKLRDALRLFRGHGALSQWPDGSPAWGFIHGNWALDNSRCESGHNFCGVNNELTVLADLGCYADFTFPAWQHTAQPRQMNSIYYAVDDPTRPKSYDRGKPAVVGVKGEGTLLLVHGPLVPYLHRGARGCRMAMDDGDIAACRRYTPDRLDRWVRAGIHVQGRPDRVFIKLHSHGAADKNREAMLGTDLEALFSDAEARYNDGKRYRLHYVTAREMFNIIKATEADAAVDLVEARDWLLKPPASATGGCLPDSAATVRLEPVLA
jgi:hypothetical protein